MTPLDLKARYQSLVPEGHFFDHDTMQFFGDTMRNYGVCSLMIGAEQWWVLHRKNPVKHGLQGNRYFRDRDMYQTTIHPSQIADIPA